MNKQKIVLLIVGILCSLLLVCLLLFLLKGIPSFNKAATSAETAQESSANGITATMDAGSVGATTDSTDPDSSKAQSDTTAVDTQDPTTDPDNGDTQETTFPLTDLPSSVVIPGQDAETGLSFPCQIPGYDLIIQKLAPYTGLFVEDGSNTQKTDVAMLLIRNASTYPLEYAQIAVKFPTETLEFYLSALPEGESIVVQERSGKSIPAGVPMEATVLAVQQAEMSLAPQISVKDNGDNSLTIENLTDEDILTTRVFYKYYMEEESLYIGGIAFTVKINNLHAKSKMVIRPSHYNSETSRVVMSRIYDTNG